MCLGVCTLMQATVNDCLPRLKHTSVCVCGLDRFSCTHTDAAAVASFSAVHKSSRFIDWQSAQHAIYQLIPINSHYSTGTADTVLFMCPQYLSVALCLSLTDIHLHSPLKSLSLHIHTLMLFLLDRGYINTGVWNLFYTLKENQLQLVTGMSMSVVV